MPQKFIVILFTLVWLSACGSDDIPNAKMVIGIVNVTPARDSIIDGFIQHMMEEYGYREDENVIYIYDGPIADDAARAEYVAGLVDQDIDLIFAVTTPAAQTAGAATETIPIVFAPITDPIGAGLVDSLAEPGGNATGITNGNPHIRRFELLLQAVPGVERIYLPYNPDGPVVQSILPQIEEAAAAEQVTLVKEELSDANAVTAALGDLPEDIEAIFIPPDILMSQTTDQWIAASFVYDLPLASLTVGEVEAGALLGYGEALIPTGQQAARLANLILNGADPSTLPVETTEYFLYINIATAEAIGLELPEPILRQATVIIREE